MVVLFSFEEATKTKKKKKIGEEWFEDQELILRFVADLYSYRAKQLQSLLSPPDGGTLLIRRGNKN